MRAGGDHETARPAHELHHGHLVCDLLRHQPHRAPDAQCHQRFPLEPDDGRIPAVLLLSRLWAGIDSGRRVGRATRAAPCPDTRLYFESTGRGRHRIRADLPSGDRRSVRHRARHGDAPGGHQPSDARDRRQWSLCLLLGNGPIGFRTRFLYESTHLRCLDEPQWIGRYTTRLGLVLLGIRRHIRDAHRRGGHVTYTAFRTRCGREGGYLPHLYRVAAPARRLAVLFWHCGLRGYRTESRKLDVRIPRYLLPLLAGARGGTRRGAVLGTHVDRLRSRARSV